ncbi:MAG: peptidylprolyl isomerase [Planctomycetaceae bacterium]|nr:peptidylprolyl isomerase [Planctomycetaceae bacterium]
MWNWRLKKDRSRRAKNLNLDARVEHLESRSLLAGNVVASLNGSHLTLTGDTADNTVEIAVNGNEVQVRGLNSTTINGGTAVFVAAANTDTLTGNVLINLGNGNDSAVFARNVKLNGLVSVVGGNGNDSLSSTGATFNRNVAFLGGAGNDTFSLQDSTTNAALLIYGEAGNDLISLTDMTVNGPVIIKGHAGDDGVSLNNVSGTGSIGMETGLGEDDVTVRNSTLGGTLVIKTRQGQDAVMLDENTFNGIVSVNTGRSNDALDIRDKNTFNKPLHVLMGDSRRNENGDITNGDQANIATQNIFNAGKRIRSEEGSTIPTAVNNRFDQATTGLIARATAADTAATTLAGMTLTSTATSSKSIQSTGNVLVTKDANVTISGATLPGATVTLDTDNDGQFDDATLTADSSGNYSTVVVVTRKDLYTSDATANDELTGLQTIKVRSTLTGVGTTDSSVTVDYVKNTVVQFTSALGTFEVEMFDSQAPITVQNFETYMTSGRYTNSIIHRSIDNFVIQGGGFTSNNGVLNSINTDAAITGEFNAARGNIKGTISMAHTGDPNSGTSQWFINLKTNSDLDDFTGKRHTVFGRVVGSGQTVVDAIGALNQEDLVAETGSSALSDVPLRTAFTEFSRPLTGTVSTTANSTTVTGVGTKFLTELKGALTGLRSRIQINGQAFFVASVDSDTQLTVSVAPTFAVSSVTAKSDFNDSDFARFTKIEEVLA